MVFTWFFVLFWTISTLAVSGILYGEIRKNSEVGDFIPVIVGVVLYIISPFLRAALLYGQSPMSRIEIHLQNAGWLLIDALAVVAVLLLLYSISVVSAKQYVPVVWGILLAMLAFLINAYAAYFIFFVAAMIQLLIEGDRRRKEQMRKILEARSLHSDDIVN